MVMGLGLAILTPAPDAWTRRFFVVFFSVLVLATGAVLSDQIFGMMPGRAAEEKLSIYLESLLASVLLPMLTVYLLPLALCLVTGCTGLLAAGTLKTVLTVAFAILTAIFCGLTVWSIGSPIGKIPIGTDAFGAHLDQLRHVLALADILGAENLRLFSFYVPDGRKEEFRGQVLDRMGRMLDTATGSGIAVCHENEKGIYGDTAPRCADLLSTFPTLRGIFDPANFVQCGQDTLEAWALLRQRIKYLHIKDALADGRVVPSGCGIGHVREILNEYRAMGGDAVTVEPHLSVFDGLQGLEQAGQRTEMGAYTYPSGDAAFDAACGALKRLL